LAKKLKQINVDLEAYRLLNKYRKSLVPKGVEPPSFSDAIKVTLRRKKKDKKKVST